MGVVLGLLFVVILVGAIIYISTKEWKIGDDSTKESIELTDKVMKKDIHTIAFWVRFFSIATLIGWGVLIVAIIYFSVSSKM